MHFSHLYTMALLTLAGFCLAQPAQATPLLRCAVTYAGSTQTIEATPVADPYVVASVDIGGRFWFKPVVVGQGSRLDYIKLYAYLDTASQPVLIQEAKYLPPFASAQLPASLTGEQHLYAGHLERELIYNCTLQGVQP
ncbi:hypothetical protein [Rhodoferax sp.]|uniref:hypothetical protein n=1 Tax=Rhodoferax sp. TaxID=50421 RepID=UPI0028468E20|nr:hypothetical protein [Rhodoferax sp.]MDR3367813.1 hypothetical protein [Rhodoferax sp.]